MSSKRHCNIITDILGSKRRKIIYYKEIHDLLKFQNEVIKVSKHGH